MSEVVGIVQNLRGLAANASFRSTIVKVCTSHCYPTCVFTPLAFMPTPVAAKSFVGVHKTEQRPAKGRRCRAQGLLVHRNSHCSYLLKSSSAAPWRCYYIRAYCRANCFFILVHRACVYVPALKLMIRNAPPAPCAPLRVALLTFSGSRMPARIGSVLG
jgi:hypothetical protein